MKLKRVLKLTAEFLLTMMVISTIVGSMALSAAAQDDDNSVKSNLPISDTAKEVYQSGDLPTPPDKTGQQIVVDLVMGGLSYVKVITGVIGVLYITILGSQLLLAQGNEEDITKAKRGLIYALIAFLMISMSQDMAKIFDMDKKSILSDPQTILQRVHIFDKQVEIFMTFVKFVIGSFATIMVIRAGIGLIIAGGNEEEVSKHRKSAMYSAGGLLLIYVGEIFIDKVFYKIDREVYTGITGANPGVDAKEGVEQIVGITNLIVSFIGPVAVLMLIGGAIMYATAGGNDENQEKAKRLIMATIIGIVIIFGAFALVSTVISSRLTDLGAIIEG